MDELHRVFPWSSPSRLRQQLQSATGLTAREVDVAAGLIGGRDSKAIGLLLNLSHHTIRNHTQNIYSKLGCNSQQTLITLLEQQGMHGTLRQHYLHLQLQPLFKQWLQTIAQSHGDDPPKLLRVHPDDRPSAWNTLIEQHLKTAGFEVVAIPHSEAPQQLTQGAFSHGLVWGDTSSLSDDITWVTIGSTVPSSSSKHINPHDHADFYAFMVHLLQLLVPSSDASAFQQAHQRLLGHSPIKAAPNLSTAAEPASVRWWPIAVAVLLLGMMVGAYTWWPQPVSQQTPQGTTWNLPPLMSYYTERPELTRQIWQRLKQHPGKGTVSLVGLRGMGGVGKTTLALEAIHYPQQAYAFRGWFKAETPELLKTDYLDLGAKLDLFTQRMAQSQKLIAVKEWLQAQPSSLLVYDNVPDMNTIHAMLPNRGHILITSRNHRMPHPIDIEGMQTMQASQLLDKLIPEALKQQQADYRTDLKTLVHELDHLPLALAQAGAYMAEHQLSVLAYLKRYREAQLLAQHVLPAQDPHEPIYVTWDLNLQAVQAHAHGEQAMQLLDAIAYLYPENIPKALLAQILFQATDEAAMARLDDTLRLLKSYSLVKSSGHHLSIHRLVHTYLPHRHQEHEVCAILQRIIHAITTLYQADAWDYTRFKSMLPHIEYLNTHVTTRLQPPQRLQLNIVLGWVYYLSGHYAQAKRLYEKILPISLQSYGELHLQTAEIYYNLGWVCYDLGQPFETKTWFEKVLPISQQPGGQQHIWIAAIYRGLGWVSRDLGQLLKAKTWFEQALVIFKEHCGEQHIWTARIYRDLGRIYLDLGQFLEAKTWLEKALTIFQTHYEKEHIWSAWTYRGLGWVYLNLGQPLAAKPWFEKSLVIYQQHYGKQHVWTARIYRGLGWVYYGLGQSDQAKTWFEQALAIVQTNYGESHIWTAKVYQGLGWVVMDLGHHQQAKSWFEQALPIYQDRYGRDNLPTGHVYDGLGWAELQLGHLDQAQAWFNKALAIRQQYQRTEHVWSLPTHHGLAQLYSKLAQLQLAKIHLQQAQQIVARYQKQGYQFKRKLHQDLAQLQASLHHLDK